jgi:uncharacterized protein YpmS
MKNPVVITMLVIALVLIGAVVAVFLLLNSCDREAAPTPTTTAAPTPAPAPSPAPAPAPTGPTIQDKLKSLEEAVEKVRATGQTQEVSIVLTEAEVNAQASQAIAQETQSGDFRVTSVKIDLKPNNVMAAELQTQALGFTIPIKVNMGVSVKDGKPAVTVTDISFGMMPVPQSMKDQIAAAIADSIDNLVVEMTENAAGEDVELEFRLITIRETDMTMVVLVKPESE